MIRPVPRNSKQNGTADANANANADAVQVHGLVRRSMTFIERHLDTPTPHGNQRLHFANIVGLLLSAAFQPTVRSLRLIEQHSASDDMQPITGRAIVPRSTLSDALARFDPEQLRPLIEALQARLPWLRRVDPDTHAITQRLLAADGSWFNLVGEVAHALTMTQRGGAKPSRVRLNLQLDLDTLLPADCDVSLKGDGSEANAFIRRLQADCVYVVDRNFVHFGFINAVRAAGSRIVLRLRKDTRFAATVDKTLTGTDLSHGIRSDQIGTLCGPQTGSNMGRRSRTGKPPGDAVLYRRIVIRDEKNDCDLILLTDLLDAPAYVIGAIYRRRWQIELFLRWLKVFACFEHLISQSARGITTQFYVAVLMTLLLHLRSGMPVSKYTLHIVQMSAAGRLSDEAMHMLLARRQRERELERLRRAKKKALI